MKRFIAAVRNIRLFQKLFLAFILIMLVPMFISYYFSQKSTTRVVVNRVFEETQNSLEVVGNQIEDILLRMIYVSLYLNNDENVRTILLDSGRPARGASRSDDLRYWTRLNTINRIFENLSFNVMRTKCFFTLVSLSGYTYTSWPTRGTDMTDYLADYPHVSAADLGMYVHWVGIEKNRVSADAASYPYVITLTKTLITRQGDYPFGNLIVSVPESEIRALLYRGKGARLWFMVDKDLRVISGSEPALLGTPILEGDRRALSSGTEGHFLTDFKGAGRSLVTYRRMRNDEWTLITIESYASITSEFGRIRTQLVWASLIAALAFIVVAAIIARSITWPIHALAENMRNVESEIALADRGSIVRTDEIGMLQRTYELMRRKTRRLMRQIAEKEKKKREAELEALQLQISPHFLFNTLSSVRWAILNRNNGKAARMTFALGNLLRMSLLKTNALITVEQEMQNLAHYIDIIKLRSGASFSVRYTVDEKVTGNLVPRLLLQPIVENAVIHGMDGTRTGGIIEVGATRRAHNLVFTVRDNGKGMKEPARGGASKTVPLSGIGMRNVDERIKLIYGDHFGLRSESSPGNGTLVTIVIPAMPRMKPA